MLIRHSLLFLSVLLLSAIHPVLKTNISHNQSSHQKTHLAEFSVNWQKDYPRRSHRGSGRREILASDEQIHLEMLTNITNS